MTETPLISCLMVTRPISGRFAFLKRSVAAYLAQTHARRELVIVIDGRATDPTTAAIKAHVASLRRPDIRIVEPEAANSLGALRNASLDAARGDVVCVWDDDDLHHPERLGRQWAALAECGGEAVCLQHVMQFFPAERRLYATNWIATEATGFPASLMCRRIAAIRYPDDGPQADLGEDRVVLRQLQARGSLRLLAHAPHLYVYVSHGANSYGDAHHRWLVDELSLTAGLLKRGEPGLRAGLAAFDFGPGAVVVQGGNGPAFTLS